MKDILIKPVVVADYYQELSHLMKGLHDNERMLYARTAIWKDIETTYMRYIMEMQQHCDGTCLMAFDGETAVGFMFGYIDEPDDSRYITYAGPDLYISDGYVEPPYRRLGIYRLMNQQLEALYIAKGVHHITRFTRHNNHNMQSFLESNGYRLTSLLYEKWVADNGQ
jgi:ribosomal protein S18 acetylase RimI-like enzyme